MKCKEFDWETLSYVITHLLEWFPSNWEIIKFDIKNEDEDVGETLFFKVLSIDNAKIGQVDVTVLKREILD